MDSNYYKDLVVSLLEAVNYTYNINDLVTELCLNKEEYGFEKVSRFADKDIVMPARKTKDSAGYDLAVAEDTILEPYIDCYETLSTYDPYTIMTIGVASTVATGELLTLDQVTEFTKTSHARPTLVSTGVKCKIPTGYYLQLSMRSSTPLKNWIIMANAPGIIDADYYGNPDNDGEIYLQLINLSPFRIQLKAGDVIGQGIILPYCNLGDSVTTERIGGFGSTSK